MQPSAYIPNFFKVALDLPPSLYLYDIDTKVYGLRARLHDSPIRFGFGLLTQTESGTAFSTVGGLHLGYKRTSCKNYCF